MTVRNTPNPHRRLVLKLLGAAVCMFGFGFALVPLYNVFCDVTGLLGKSGRQVASADPHSDIDRSRTITIQFTTHVSNDLPWLFAPEVKQIQLHPGELRKVIFNAENRSKHSTVVQAVPSITPGYAASYLKKTQCFCFEQQQLDAWQNAPMPVVFYIDNKLPKEVEVLTLSYSLFAANKPVTGNKI